MKTANKSISMTSLHVLFPMSTANIMDKNRHEDLEFAYGSGHLNPEDAVDPGLVYDASEADYIDFLCKQGYNSTLLGLITGDNSTTCSSSGLGRGWNLNYPSFAVAVEDGQGIYATFNRTVTNVGSANSTYTLTWYMPASVTVSVEPSLLSFSALGEKKSFTVTVKGSPITQQPIVSGAIVWNDGIHWVRSPLVMYNILPGTTYPSYSMPNKTPNFKSSTTVYRKNGFLGRN